MGDPSGADGSRNARPLGTDCAAPELALYSVLAEALGITAPHILLFGAKRECFPSVCLAASLFHESLTGEIRRGNQIFRPCDTHLKSNFLC